MYRLSSTVCSEPTQRTVGIVILEGRNSGVSLSVANVNVSFGLREMVMFPDLFGIMEELWGA